jgi:hypothetical protein
MMGNGTDVVTHVRRNTLMRVTHCWLRRWIFPTALSPKFASRTPFWAFGYNGAGIPLHAGL